MIQYLMLVVVFFIIGSITYKIRSKQQFFFQIYNQRDLSKDFNNL